MQSDGLTRVLLAVIALCAVVLVVRSLQENPGTGRFQLSSIRAGTPLLLRADTVTGQVWKLELRGGRDRWVAFKEPGADDGKSAGDEEVSSRNAGSAAPNEVASSGREAHAPPAAAPAPAARAPSRPAVPAPIDQDVGSLRKAISDAQLPIDIRVWAAQRLASMSDPRASQALIEALGDPDAELAFAAVEDKLAESGNPQVRAAAEKLRAARNQPRAAKPPAPAPAP